MDLGPVDSYPLAPMQLGMVADNPIIGTASLDVIQLDCELEAELDTAAFAAAWQWAANRHDALRTAFRWTSDGVRQDLYPVVRLPVTHLEKGSPEEWERFVRADRRQGFSLDRAPLARCAFMPSADCQRFLLSFHHSVLDGRSLLTLVREVFARYEGLRCGTSPIAPPTPPPYRAYIDWLAAHDISGDEDFWRGVLRGFRTPTLLVAERGGSTTSHDEHDVLVPPETSAALRAVAQRYDCTLNTIIQAAWAILLSRYCGQNDVVFGAVRSVRRGTVPDVDAMVGLLINTLPVRATVADDQPLHSFLTTLRQQAVAVRAHQHTSLMDIQRWAEIPAGERLFDSLVVYENFLLDEVLRAQGGIWDRRRFRVRRQPNYPLVLQVFAQPAMLLKLLHDRSRFAPAVIDGMARHLTNVLDTIATDPEIRVGDIAMLSATERRRILVEWNAPDATGMPERGTLDVVAARAAIAPDTLAVRSDARETSYRELDRWANRIAAALGHHGVARGSVVALPATPVPETVAGMLGILRAGAACLLLDPAVPAERLRRLMRIADADIVLAAAPLDDEWDDVVRVDPHHVAEFPATAPGVAWRPEAAALIVDVAGAADEPRPLVVPHATLTDLTTWGARWHGLSPNDRVAVCGSGAATTVWGIWPALGAGASVHTPPAPADGATAGRWLAPASVTAAFLPAAHAAPMIRELAAMPGAMRVVTVVGRRWVTDEEDVPFEIRYLCGPPEAGLLAVGGAATGPTELVAGSRAYVVDQAHRPTPAGVTGELLLAGAGLAWGYLGSPALTADRFRPDPFSDTPGARVFHSGEAARRTLTGTLEFLGRAAMSRIAGLRPDPTMVEKELRRHPDVVDAAVTVVGGELVGFIVARPGWTRVDELRQRARARLPRHLVPARIIPVAAFDVTGAGLLDHAHLARLAADEAEPAGATPPPSDLHTQIASLWAQVLGCDSAGEAALLDGSQDFFELGGHSLFAVTAALRLSEKFDTEIPARLIFDAPTVAEFAARLDDLMRARGTAVPERITPMRGS